MGETQKFEGMKIFAWDAECRDSSGNLKTAFYAMGYILAHNREEAEAKLALIPLGRDDAVAQLNDDDCGRDGTEVNADGIALRWFD